MAGSSEIVLAGLVGAAAAAVIAALRGSSNSPADAEPARTSVKVLGVGNSANSFGLDPIGQLADQLNDELTIDPPTADEMVRMAAALRARAVDGDPVAALVLVRAAELQRHPQG